MKNPSFLSVLLFVLWGGYFYAVFIDVLKDAQPLKEITVEIRKLPEYSIDWRIALKRYPDIKQHGAAFRCVWGRYMKRENFIIIPRGMDCSIRGQRNPYDKPPVKPNGNGGIRFARKLKQ